MSRIALIGENSIEHVNVLLDIWNNGDCVVLLDWRIPFEAAYQIMQEASVTRCYIEKRLFDEASIPNNSSIMFETFVIANYSAHLLPEKIRKQYRENDSQDEAVILYSSGTTGKSKGIILTHFAININAEAILDYMSLNNNDCLYIVKSLSHSATLTGELLAALKSGADVVLAPTIVPPRYVLNQIAKFNVTVLCLNPLLVRMYAEEYQRKKYVINSLKTIYISGAVLNDDVYSIAHKTFKNIDIFNVYGLSEAGPRVTAQTKECCKSNSVGRAIRDVEIMVVDDNGKPVKDHERGIIHVKTPSRFSGYVFGTAKQKSLYLDWLNTGDIGFIDEYGELHIIDRVDDMIIINAHKVYPGDIEKLILMNPDVTDCAVSRCFRNGEDAIGCIYVGKTGLTTDIIRQLKKSLMPYEIPKCIVKVDSIPHSVRGKVDKQEVSRILALNC